MKVTLSKMVRIWLLTTEHEPLPLVTQAAVPLVGPLHMPLMVTPASGVSPSWWTEIVAMACQLLLVVLLPEPSRSLACIRPSPAGGVGVAIGGVEPGASPLPT